MLLRRLIRESINEIVNNDEKFKPTVSWMAEMYDKANKELFNGELGECILKAEPITSHGSYLGMFNAGRSIACSRRDRRMYVKNYYGMFDDEYINKNNFFETFKPTITLNTMYFGTDSSLYCTLVHEMCHYYTYMHGYAPKQAHGVEFRQIGQIIQYRSNGEITIQRLASAEQMAGYVLEPEEQLKRDKRVENKKNKMQYIFIFKNDGSIRLVGTTLQKVIDIVMNKETIACGGHSTIIKVTNQELKNELYNDGYSTSLTKYSYYPIDNTKKAYNILQTILANKNNYEALFQGDKQIPRIR